MPYRKRLLVEGKDDKYVLWRVCAHHQIPGDIDPGIAPGSMDDPPLNRFEIKEKKGVEDLLETLDVELDASLLEQLGIVVDADLDLAARWQSITDRLANLGYRLPGAPDAHGTIAEQQGRPRVGIWIMPDNRLPGMLEDFVSLLGAVGDPLWGLADKCLSEIPEESRKFSTDHRIKAHIHTWLAWQERPGLPLGLAITSRYLDANAMHAQQLIGWIRRLFDL